MNKFRRTFYLLKCRTHILVHNLAEKLFKFLAKCNLVLEHKNHYANIKDLTNPMPMMDMTSDRYVFEVSYVQKEIELVYEYWFTNKNGKKLFVINDSHHKEGRISYRAELKSFFAHFSPRHRMWVHRHSPLVEYLERIPVQDTFRKDPFTEPVKVKIHRCDFSQCRFAFEFSYAPELHTKDKSTEVISESYRVFQNGLTSKIPKINKMLTGVDYDGDMMSPKNMPLSENRLCYKCGLPVFSSAKDKYKFECLNHGELSVEEVRRVDPVTYDSTMRYCMDYLEALIKKSCPQDSNL